ncbi:MAG: ubiquinol-cytochrome c reductase cytochrome c1 subunit [Alteromonadaceae bacterium]|jgi:ubiquinol-cytochrome c reductase cytochrome c1 subunit
MKKLLIILLAILPTLAMASSGHGPILEHANVDLTDKAALQRGAKLYMNYCLGCHTLQYQRYERTFTDIGIPLDLGQQNLMQDGDKIGQLITNAMNKDDAARWFGAPPPDLSLENRLRGPDWVYTYLKSFYIDPSRPFGVNNEVFPDVGMPHALMELQGTPVKATERRLIDGEYKDVYIGLKAEGGEMNAAEYDQAALDLTTFLAYVGEPSRLDSEAIGKKVLWFLLLLLVMVFALKKEFWRDIH